MGMTEKIRIMLVKQGNISEAELARRLGQTPANLHHKMKRDNFSEKELREIAEALDCGLKINLVMNKTGEEI
ncbi:helix-turn-helix domain-containing protein [Leadbettera azotonutricia]|jgi:IS30 family transposase|uniref:Conserved domain protein n=1 Tax=Leadbettera azotonutricia (strain ATCC BAA-888 / DSM 13862 / ZAS-9) TaxID=545695 RepID=F5Y7L8_LEAAZ|nr:helix-turn-helix domain-containing protein [Leadbettera azotonutricia]AEF82105.1 conserved domain protein [Leadbettera azotonutricia ZAS-9]